jgi:putative PEP-CTERM system histidine kinase
MPINLVPPLPFVSAAAAGALGIASLARSRRQVADWALAAGMILLAAEEACVGLSAGAGLSPNGAIGWQEGRMLCAALLPGSWLLFSLSYARGNAREFIARWAPALAAAFVLPAGLAAAFSHRLVVAVSQAGPGLPRTFGLGWPGLVLSLLLLAGSVLIVTNLERTIRAAVGTQRWRIKYMLMGVGLVFVMQIYVSAQAVLFRRIDPYLETLAAGSLIVASLLALRSLVRVGRIELDVYPSHAVLKNSITVVLAGVYLLLVGLCARMVSYLGGGAVLGLEAFLLLASIVFLAVLLQSDRLRMRLGRLVSRSFQRPLYDYRTVWRKFIEGTATPVDSNELCRSLVRLVAELFQSLSVAIWLIDGDSFTLAVSTSLPEAKGGKPALSKEEAAEIISHFREFPEPHDIESAKAGWAGSLRRIHPCEFPRRENRVCLPMIVRGRPAGMILLGDRVGGAAFSSQDYDMLKCVADHATAGLVRVQQSQRLVEAKELEAFQTMAAFFVHDLKNSAAALCLMTRNLTTYFEDPEFQKDTLRGVSESVAHINHVIERLGHLSREPKVRPIETDFNHIVSKVAAGFESEPDFAVVKDLAPLPKLALDREQIAQVVTNLVLNAKEAMVGKGSAQVATRRDAGWAVLAVRDSGCGMTSDFITQSLFRPFRTTKRNGLGIGMFQSKMIVEAHGGRIAVASEPGSGTTFQVFLPVPGKAG